MAFDGVLETFCDVSGDVGGVAEVDADHEIGLAIAGGSFGEEGANFFEGIFRLEEGAMRLSADAVVDGFWAGPEAGDEAVGAEAFEILRVDDHAAAGGDDLLFLGGEFGDEGFFEGAEGGFAIVGEDIADAAAGALFDEFVGIDESEAEEFGEEVADGGFACAHEADEGDVVEVSVRRHGARVPLNGRGSDGEILISFRWERARIAP